MCPFCGLTSPDAVVIASTTYNGDIDPSIYDEMKRRKNESIERNSPYDAYVSFTVTAPLWISRVILCSGCGSCHVNDDTSDKAKVIAVYPDNALLLR